ncbi:MAG: hypothetical protein WB767_04880 [Nocardioides sp.]
MLLPIVEPVAPALGRRLRHAVIEHARSGCRRVFPPEVRVGVPGAATTELVLDDTPLDHALRTDIVEAMSRRVGDGAGEVLVWLARTGERHPVEDIDLAWLAASRTAAAELAVTMRMVVIDRHGWRDPASGVSRSWVRLR